MSDTKRFDKELLSAWVDGQAPSHQDDDLCEASLEQGSESMSVWARYHMIGQVMREEAQHLDLDISAKVSQAVAAEPSHELPEKVDGSNVIPFPGRVWKQVGGFAIAASVALVALFNVSNTQTNVVSNQPLASTANDSEVSVDSVNNTKPAIASNVDRQELQRMHDMFLKHEALTRQITGMSSLPTVTVVSNQKVIPVQVPMRAAEKQNTVKEQPEESQE
ncbi:sigma-E factor negative regulatory protein [Kangiella shandongensis]|uniref:sigma-E factor negative regulatory protein n=1 Tax=Kangiella shandongensis TaxID=2763258 RepID=UPI001CC086A4|nr:sigma-E factor negative regulatory protein [Kangiella shandongensis]